MVLFPISDKHEVDPSVTGRLGAEMRAGCTTALLMNDRGSGYGRMLLGEFGLRL